MQRQMVCQVDDLAMGASLAVAPAMIWLESFEHQIKPRKEIVKNLPESVSEACPEYNRSLL